MSDLPNTVTKEQLDDLVARSKVEYAVFDEKLTVAVITLPNKFKVTGEASCVDAKNFNKELGEKYALEKAIENLWELEGYLLAERLYHRNEWLENQTGDFPVKCAAPADPDHELTDGEVATLASGGSLCGCTWVELDGTEHPIEKGDLVDFGTALHLMQLGERVMREGWNGKNMWLIYVEADQYELKAWKYFNATEQLPFIALKTADNNIVPWTISQADALATDWCLA